MTSQQPEDDPRADLPAEGRRRGLFSQLGGTRLCCSICSPSWCPRIAAIKLGSSFFPLGCWAPPHQQQNPQQCKNSLTPNEKGPHFLLKPLTDRLHSLQTYNNTKQKQQTQPPNITQLQKNRCSGTGARCLLPSTKSNSSESLQGAPTPPTCSEPRLWTRLSSSLLPSHPQESDRLSAGHLNQPDSHWEGSGKHLAPPENSGAPQRILWPSSP